MQALNRNAATIALAGGMFLAAHGQLVLAQCEQAKLMAPDGAAGDWYGWWVSLSGDRAIVGAPRDDEAQPSDPDCDSGSAYVYRRDGDAWVQEAKLTAAECVGGEAIGNPVGISGDVAVLGAHGNVGPGLVYVFRWNGASWLQEQVLAASDAARYDDFGLSVSVSVNGDRMAVGAPGRNCDGGSRCGSAYVFRYDGSLWVEEAKVTSPDPASQDQFGNSIALDADRMIVGVWKDNDACPDGYLDCGSAYVFRRDGTSWAMEAKLTASDGAMDDNFGASVSIHSEVVVVGTALALEPCGDGSDCHTGSAYVFRSQGANWIEEAKLISSDPTQGKWFGKSVVVSDDKVLVGAPGPYQTQGGSIYVFGHDGAGWTELGSLSAADTAVGDHLGMRVSLSGEYALVGAPRSDDGSAYVFRLFGEPDANSNGLNDFCEDCNGNGIPDEVDIAGETSDDCNANGLPDECEPDCNENGIADACDITGDISEDCTGNGIPDECEPDCNENSVADSCDIAGVTSDDCTANDVPDECEPDCNENSVADSCDIAAGTSQDCNENGVPDTCDLARESSDDCTGDGIPDECDPDCNLTGTPDSCDILDGTSQDVDNDGIPDECENWSLCQTGPGYFDFGPHRIDAEAEQLAIHLSGLLRAPDDEYDRIHRDLQLIRGAYPVLSTVVDDPDYAPNQLMARLEAPGPWPGYEDMNTFYQVVEDRVISESLEVHLLTFCDSLNAPVLAPEYEVLPEVRYAEPNFAFGGGDMISIGGGEGGTYRYTIVDGFNDCIAGCLCERIWVIDVETDGTVRLLSYEAHGWSECIFDETACCLPGGVCTVMAIASCLDQGGTPLVFGTTCDSEGISACPAGIPTVSEWGIVAMTLLVLTAGTLVNARRRAGRLAAA